MTDYTPTTEEVRECYRFGMDYEQGMADDDAREEFDRWLAEVKARAWEEGAECAYDNFHLWEYRNRKEYFPEELNPYRQGENK